jgi:hypothetical protein
VGGSPILAVLGRAKYQPEHYKSFVKWVKKLDRYIEDIVVPRLDADKKEIFDQVTKIVYPLANRLDKATGDMLLPALADSQGGFVLDGKIKSDQWIQQMPKSDSPLPMIEPAIVLGVSDVALLKKAFSEYRAIGNDTIAKVREAIPFVPEFQIPEPDTKEAKGGTLYYYPLPPVGLDPQIGPNAGLGAHVVVFTISQSHTERLLADTPLKVSGGPLADLNKPRSGAAYFDFAGLIDLFGPWIDYAIKQKAQEGAGSLPPGMTLESLQSQIHSVLDVLKCLKSFSSSTYVEDKVQVTHNETIFKDL